jgi:hypothetical protein
MHSTQLIATFCSLLTTLSALDSVGVCGVARSETVLHKAVEVVLVSLMRFKKGTLDALHKHVSDGLEGSLDVIVKLPARLLDGLLNQTLDQCLHLRDIAFSNDCQQMPSR